ncbi:hypothetical protein ACI2KR_09345 [Pseudomonas luteola]
MRSAFEFKQTLLIDKIASLAITYEDSENSGIVKRSIERVLSEWVDNLLSEGKTSGKMPLAGISKEGFITSMDVLIEAAENYEDVLHQELVAGILTGLIQEEALGNKGELSKSDLLMYSALLDDRAEIIARCKTIGIDLIDRKIDFTEALGPEQVDAFYASTFKDTVLGEVCDLRSDAVYCPSKNMAQVLQVLSENGIGVRSISAYPESIPGLKDNIDLKRRLERLAEFGHQMPRPRFDEPNI